MGEQVFEREGKFFSCDMRATKSGEVPEADWLPYELSLFVECKYLKPPKALVFASLAPTQLGSTVSFEAPGSMRNQGFNALMVSGLEVLRPLPSDKTGFALGLFNLLKEWVPISGEVCHKGTIVGPSESYEFFREAQFQLSFPLMGTFLRAIDQTLPLIKESPKEPVSPEMKKLFGVFYPRIRIALYIPIIVTNAPLYVLHRGLGLEDFEAASSIKGISEPATFIKYSASVPGELARFFRGECESIRDRIRAQSPEGFNSLDLAEILSQSMVPYRYYIVQSDALGSFTTCLENDFLHFCSELAAKWIV